MKIFSLSHTDLDGYGSQLVLSKYFDFINYYNTDYGDIDDALQKILQKIEHNDMLYITDLNLTLEQSEFIDNKSKEIGFDILLMDHHITGLESSKKYDWYNLDVSMSATCLTYKTMAFKYGKIDDFFTNTVNLIDTYDMWRENEEYFGKAQLLSNSVFDFKIDSPKNTKFILALIEKIGILLFNHSTKETEKLIPDVIENILLNLAETFEMKNFIGNENIPSGVKVGTFPAETLDQYILKRTEINGIPVIIYDNISSRTSQYAFSYILKYNDSKVLVKYNSYNDTISCRSKNGKAVEIAKFFGGGGHKDAAGAKLTKPILDYWN